LSSFSVYLQSAVNISTKEWIMKTGEQFPWQSLLLQEVGEWSEKLIGTGIPVGKVTDATINHRARKRWGQCVGRPDGTFELNFSAVLFHREVPERARASVICHELLHTVNGCANHGYKWKQYSKIVCERFGLPVKTTISAAELGIPEKYTAVSKHSYKYRIVCSKCGAEILRDRLSPLVRHPERYIHTGCGGRFRLL
jgi:predicted SprT family Zn-dependent metalloprotease